MYACWEIGMTVIYLTFFLVKVVLAFYNIILKNFLYRVRNFFELFLLQLAEGTVENVFFLQLEDGKVE